MKAVTFIPYIHIFERHRKWEIYQGTGECCKTRSGADTKLGGRCLAAAEKGQFDYQVTSPTVLTTWIMFTSGWHFSYGFITTDSITMLLAEKLR